MIHNDHRLLTADEEIDLAMRIEAGQDAAQRITNGDTASHLVNLVADGAVAREMLILHNLRMVHGIARKYYTSDVACSYDDLVQEGTIGLMTAADRYDWRGGQRFSTFATWWVRQSVARAQKQSGTIRLPIVDAPRKNQSLAHLRERASYVGKLDDPLPGRHGDEGRTLLDILPARENTEDEALNRIMVERLLKAPMPETWRAIVRDWMNGYTAEEAGERQGLSRSILWLAKQRIREAVNE